MIIKTEEVIENGITYIVEYHSSGAIVKYIKPTPLTEPIEPYVPEPTQLDRIEKALSIKNEELRQEGADAVTLELIERGIL